MQKSSSQHQKEVAGSIHEMKTRVLLLGEVFRSLWFNAAIKLSRESSSAMVLAACPRCQVWPDLTHAAGSPRSG